MTSDERSKQADDHDTAAGAPGASGPGEPGYEGVTNLGEEGANPDLLPGKRDDEVRDEPEL